MKLSEMSTAQAAECMAELAEPIEHLATHERVAALLSGQNKDMTLAGIISMVCRAIPALLRDCYRDTVRVVAVLTGKTVEQVGLQPIKVTISDVRSAWDDDLRDFFRSSTPTVQDA